MRNNCFYEKRAKSLWEHVPQKDDADSAEMFSQLRYTPITTQGKDTLLKPLDQAKPPVLIQYVEKQRKIKLFIVATMYAEPPKGGPFENQEDRAGGLIPSLKGIAANIEEYVYKHGPDSWRDIAVCIVQDGRTKICDETLKWLELQGCYSHELMMQQETEEIRAMRAKDSKSADWRSSSEVQADNANLGNGIFTYGGAALQMHLFETILCLQKHGIHDSTTRNYPPMQVMFAYKEGNAGKLDSHLWFFNAFSAQLFKYGLLSFNLLLDVGTVPYKRAILKLLYALQRNPRLAGCCGEIAVDNVCIATMLNPVIAAQHFEYKISNILDKSLESVFGYISVLPGAFCAYRYEAVRGSPLKEYFKSITHELDPFQGNMYLAEDRILCFELIAKKGGNWVLCYIKNAVAVTDVPDELYALIKQRR
jgi:chitin synthase